MGSHAHKPEAAPRSAKPGLHPRNRHAAGYDFPKLIKASPGLAPWVLRARHGGPSIDFSNPEAVRALNRALLLEAYGIRQWEIPAGYLCPPLPGRADYVHHLADLLATGADDIPRGPAVRVLDVGTGASLIYPIAGHGEYGWSFAGTEVDARALTSARNILRANAELAKGVALRRQHQGGSIFAGVVKPEESFDLSLCNPPFHGSLQEAKAAAQDKWRKLGRGSSGSARNFGGQGPELWCEGGEAGFLQRMIEESAAIPRQVRWFTSLVSRSATLPEIQQRLRRVGALEVKVVPMAQGQKQSRFVAWTFLDAETRRAFRSTPPADQESP